MVQYSYSYCCTNDCYITTSDQLHRLHSIKQHDIWRTGSYLTVYFNAVSRRLPAASEENNENLITIAEILGRNSYKNVLNNENHLLAQCHGRCYVIDTNDVISLPTVNILNLFSLCSCSGGTSCHEHNLNQHRVQGRASSETHTSCL